MKSSINWLVTTHAIDRWKERVDKVNDELAREQLLNTIKVSHLIDRTTNGHLVLHYRDIRSDRSIFFVVSTETDNSFRIITVFTKKEFRDHKNYTPEFDILASQKITVKKETKQLEIRDTTTEPTTPFPTTTATPPNPPTQHLPLPPSTPSKGWLYKAFVYEILEILITTRSINQIYMLALRYFPERLSEIIKMKRIKQKIDTKFVSPVILENFQTDSDVII